MLSVIENLINLILIKHLAFNLLLHLLLAGGWEKLIGHLKSSVTHALTGGVSKAPPLFYQSNSFNKNTQGLCFPRRTHSINKHIMQTNHDLRSCCTSLMLPEVRALPNSRRVRKCTDEFLKWTVKG